MNTVLPTEATQLSNPRLSFLSSRKFRTNLLLLLVLIPVALVIMTPYLWMITGSLKHRGTIGEPPYLFPVTFDFSNYLKAWEGAPFARYFLNTAIVAITVVLSRVIIGSMAAYAFAVLKFKGRDLLFMLYLSTMMIPFYAVVIPTYLIIKDLAWFNSFQALIVPRMVDAFAILLLRQAFIAVPKDYLDAARIDGASHWRILWRIIFPMSRPTVLTVAIFSFLFIWNDFLWPLLVANDTNMRLIQTGLQAFSGRYLTEWTYWMAGTMMATLPPILLFLAAQKQFISGLSRTGLRA
ncbi:MAG: carbohydrate ABC transporter permease [Chloroflexi bacterium]|nr:carbohydrate ABC transporter permease [Chloroflexota bacterium]